MVICHWVMIHLIIFNKSWSSITRFMMSRRRVAASQAFKGDRMSCITMWKNINASLRIKHPRLKDVDSTPIVTSEPLIEDE